MKEFFDRYENLLKEGRTVDASGLRQAIEMHIESLEKDAGRYRWLRRQPNDCTAPRIDICLWTCYGDDSVNTGEGLRLDDADEAIDTAMQGV